MIKRLWIRLSCWWLLRRIWRDIGERRKQQAMGTLTGTLPEPHDNETS